MVVKHGIVKKCTQLIVNLSEERLVELTIESIISCSRIIIFYTSDLEVVRKKIPPWLCDLLYTNQMKKYAVECAVMS